MAKGPESALIGRVYKERDYRFDRWVRVVDIEGEKAVVVTVCPDPSADDGWKSVATRRTRVRLDRLTRPSLWEPQERLSPAKDGL